MGFWWVNHKQTFKQEIDGGYYINLTLTDVNDTVFSYAHGSIRAVGRVVRKYQDHLRPNEFGDIGEQWDRNGWLVKVDWELLETPPSPKAHISKIAPLPKEVFSNPDQWQWKSKMLSRGSQ